MSGSKPIPDPACASLKGQLEEQITWHHAQEGIDPGHMIGGNDWFQLSPEEEHTFQIDRARFPRMIMAVSCYEAFKGMADDPGWADELITKAHADFPQFHTMTVTAEDFSLFAAEFASLTMREAHAIWSKHEYWQVRNNIMIYADEQRPDHDL